MIDCSLTVSSNQLTLLTDLLNEIDVGGLYVEDYSRMEEELQQIGGFDYIDDALLQKDRTHATVHWYPQDEQEAAHLEQTLLPLLQQQQLPTAIAKTLLADNWQEQWKEAYPPIDAGTFCIVPPWEENPPADKIVITIDPGMAFGTGQHETTRCCLHLLSELTTLRFTKVLDMGCGSGILGIAALKSVTEYVLALDIERESVQGAKENAKENGVADHIQAALRPSDASLLQNYRGSFPLILANIMADVLLKDLPLYHELMEENGFLILGGILQERCNELETALSTTGFQLTNKKQEGDWVALLAKKVS